ncbi:MAG: hypothetical protein AAFY71_08715 [Bacteroidota bacterium]
MAKTAGVRTKTFEDLNNDFYSAFDNPEIFNCLEFNLIKVAQEGIKVQYTFKSYFGRPWWIFNGIRNLKKSSASKVDIGKLVNWQKHLSTLAKRPYLVFDNGTYVENKSGVHKPVFSENIIQSLGREQVVYIRELPRGSKGDVGYDIDMEEVLNLIHCIPVGKEEKELYQSLLNTHQTIKENSSFSGEELYAIKMSFFGFWQIFVVANFVMKQLQPKKAFFNCHYHKEGIIMALKRKGIFTTEFQHGLIDRNDFFYFYPEKVEAVMPKALFADEFLAYGKYWRDLLLEGVEYTEDQLKIGGFYLYQEKGVSEELKQELERRKGSNGKIILISLQTNLYAVFNDYITWLSEDMTSKGQEGIILVKPHPIMKPETYSPVVDLPNVLVTRESIHGLFSVSDLHISIYSTTLYEALASALPNFALYVESCRDYISTILDNGVATKLPFDQNPLEMLEKGSTNVDSKYFFEVFQPENILSS